AKSWSDWYFASSSSKYWFDQPPCSNSPTPPGSVMTPSTVRYSAATIFLISRPFRYGSFAADRDAASPRSNAWRRPDQYIQPASLSTKKANRVSWRPPWVTSAALADPRRCTILGAPRRAREE